MKNIICQTQSEYFHLNVQVNDIIRRAMTPLYGNNIDLISAEAEVENITQLQWIAKIMLEQCNRVVILAAQHEDTSLIVAKSANVTHLYVNEIMESIVSMYGGDYKGDAIFAQATFYQNDIVPDLIDSAVQSVIVALPYKH